MRPHQLEEARLLVHRPAEACTGWGAERYFVAGGCKAQLCGCSCGHHRGRDGEVFSFPCWCRCVWTATLVIAAERS